MAVAAPQFRPCFSLTLPENDTRSSREQAEDVDREITRHGNLVLSALWEDPKGPSLLKDISTLVVEYLKPSSSFNELWMACDLQPRLKKFIPSLQAYFELPRIDPRYWKVPSSHRWEGYILPEDMVNGSGSFPIMLGPKDGQISFAEVLHIEGRKIISRYTFTLIQAPKIGRFPLSTQVPQNGHALKYEMQQCKAFQTVHGQVSYSAGLGLRSQVRRVSALSHAFLTLKGPHDVEIVTADFIEFRLQRLESLRPYAPLSGPNQNILKKTIWSQKWREHFYE